MNRSWLKASLCCLCLVSALLGCTTQNTPNSLPETVAVLGTPPATPGADMLRVNGTFPTGSRLRVTVPSIKLLNRPADQDVQVFAVLADPLGTYSYLLYPANRSGVLIDEIDLTPSPLEIGLAEETTSVSLWLLAVHNTHYATSETFGIEALVASLGFGFRNWLAHGDPADDPLAAVIDASDNALYDWFGEIEVLSQLMITFHADQNWNIGLDSQRAPDGGMNAVYTVQFISAEEAALLPTATPTESSTTPSETYALIVDEDFENASSTLTWFEGQDSTYFNHLTDGAYEIRLTDIVKREFGLSWGSAEGLWLSNYRVEAVIRLVEDNVLDARYGIWFNYQDDYNFDYFGVSNAGEYRAAVILRNRSQIEIQNWTPHPAVQPGAASNTLFLQSSADGTITLAINGETVKTFQDTSFDSGSVAFFCYARSVPATCRLEHLRIWQLSG